jgi:glyoxylase-like metal-dependent hydrolase (beta-lactamase superfamily II)
MTQLTRRAVLAGAAAATALSPFATNSPAQAAAPLASKQAPGWYRYKVGSIEITVATDGARANPLTDTFIRNVPKEETNKALEAMYLEKDKIVVPYTPIAVNTGSKLVVIDTGLGGALYEQSKGAVGQFQTNLAAAGIDAKAVDTVIISHFHGDHINGLITADNKPAFPNAEVMVPAGEWKFWNDDGEMSKATGNALVEGNFKNVKRVFGALGNKVTQYEPGKEVAPGITSIAAYGHTPGHTVFAVASGNASLLVLGDTTNHPALFARHPEWQAVFDVDGSMAAETRKRLLDRTAADRMLVQGYHFPFPASGHIAREGNGYEFVPVLWQPTL